LKIVAPFVNIDPEQTHRAVNNSLSGNSMPGVVQKCDNLLMIVGLLNSFITS